MEEPRITAQPSPRDGSTAVLQVPPVAAPPVAAFTLTAAAGVLHLVAARAHLGGSELIVAGFVAVGLVQVLLLGLVRSRPESATEWALAVNLASIGAWAVSRTVGLPAAIGGEGVERIGLGDLTVVALQAVAVILLLLPDDLGRRLQQAGGSFAVVAGLGAVALAAPSAATHDHGDHAHGPVSTSQVATATPVGTVAGLGFLGPSDRVGEDPFAETGSAARMKALMTGVAEDGRNGRTVALNLGLLGPNDRIGRAPFADSPDAAGTMKRWMTGLEQRPAPAAHGDAHGGDAHGGDDHHDGTPHDH